MGMMINNSIETLTSILKEATEGVCYVTFADAEALKMTIDTMRKYQKIEEIVRYRHGEHIFKILDAIVEVVEDGNDD